MHQCGILGRLIPAFERITGRIQHDLFHVYTVDQHTLFLLRNIGLLHKQEETRMSVLKQAWAQVDKPELLVLAGLFHDIGKGRGGDHSQIGAQEARRFARRLQLSARDTELIIWLVEQHLQMSTVSQRRDLEDPQVIQDFARMVGDERHLAYLLLLTVADMRATNPDLWNDWKGLLLSTLYRATATELQQEDRSRQDLPHIVRDRQANALQCLTQEEQIRARVFWQHLSGAYFSRYSENELLWHIQQILAHKSRKTLVAVRAHQPEGSEILIYGPDRPVCFSKLPAPWIASPSTSSTRALIPVKMVEPLTPFWSLTTVTPLREPSRPTRIWQRGCAPLSKEKPKANHILVCATATHAIVFLPSVLLKSVWITTPSPAIPCWKCVRPIILGCFIG